jgi:uncharacterized protein
MLSIRQVVLTFLVFGACWIGFIAWIAHVQQVGHRPTWLLFTKSADFEHTTIARQGDAPSYLFVQLEPVFAAHGIRLIESKDGRLFEPSASISGYAGYVFFTTGDLTTEGKDKHPAMTLAGFKHLLGQIERGTPFIGLHCTSDTFHSPAGGPPSDFVKMLGGEFDAHGDQQVATARIVDKNFPGVGEQADWTFNEEWYALKNLANDIHPIHVLNPAGLKGDMYARPEYPITWTRMHGKGRVFYTAMAHREETIASKAYLNLIGGAIDWCRVK